MELEPGALIAERFRLERELGRGGMGSVWSAHDTQLDTAAAVKFILAPDPTGGLRDRFAREARAAAKLRSPHIVTILAHGESDGVPYIAMEYLEGEDLGARLARIGRLGPDALLTLLDQLARALGKAHAAGIVHRDLKPENLFLVRDEDREMVKVVDFGIAKSMTSVGPTTATGAMMGTPYYMSPEQARGTKEVDYRADLYAVGVICFQCLVGRRPFEATTLPDLVMKIMVDPPPVPSAVAPHLPPAFDDWWAKAIARDSAQRFQSAREMVDALATVFRFTPPEAALPPAVAPVAAAFGTETPAPLSRTDPLPKRSKPASKKAVAIVLAIVAALVGATAARWRSETPKIAPAAISRSASDPADEVPSAPASSASSDAPPPARSIATTPATPAESSAVKTGAGKGPRSATPPQTSGATTTAPSPAPPPTTAAAPPVASAAGPKKYDSGF